MLTLERLPRGHQKWELSKDKADYGIHSKVFVGNSKDIAISSFNLDPRSLKTNLESAAVIKNCPELAKHVELHAKLLTSGLSQE